MPTNGQPAQLCTTILVVHSCAVPRDQPRILALLFLCCERKLKRFFVVKTVKAKLPKPNYETLIYNSSNFNRVSQLFPSLAILSYNKFLQNLSHEMFGDCQIGENVSEQFNPVNKIYTNCVQLIQGWLWRENRVISTNASKRTKRQCLSGAQPRGSFGI